MQMNLYGTHDVAASFRTEVKKVMVAMGYQQSTYNPNLYYHGKRHLKTLVHGMDSVAVGKLDFGRRGCCSPFWDGDCKLSGFTHVPGAILNTSEHHKIVTMATTGCATSILTEML